jgi:hypothetical protein
MSSDDKAKKQLGKALAVLMTLTSLFGITAGPALAYDESWTLEVNVSVPEDPCAGVDDIISPPTWQPDTSVTYPNGNTYDIYSGGNGQVQYEIAFNWLEGSRTVCGEDPTTLRPEGVIASTFTAIDSGIDVYSPCSSSCNSGDNFEYDQGKIAGHMDVSGSNTLGLRTGTFTVTWTPTY